MAGHDASARRARSIFVLAEGTPSVATHEYTLTPIGVIRSPLTRREDAPMQGHEGAPDAWLEVYSTYVDGLDGVVAGDELVVITWLHQAQRDVLRVHPRDDESNPLTGVFKTRSSDRPNPLGLHRVTVRAVDGARLKVGPIEAIDGTPVVDVKVALRPSGEA
jgi:tRNA-Thr(GGU) m(6)t(6)A37 methyltransferase TsaA